MAASESSGSTSGSARSRPPMIYYICTFCQKGYKTKQELVRHKKQWHADEMTHFDTSDNATKRSMPSTPKRPIRRPTESPQPGPSGVNTRRRSDSMSSSSSRGNRFSPYAYDSDNPYADVEGVWSCSFGTCDFTTESMKEMWQHRKEKKHGSPEEGGNEDSPGSNRSANGRGATDSGADVSPQSASGEEGVNRDSRYYLRKGRNKSPLPINQKVTVRASDGSVTDDVMKNPTHRGA